MPPGLRPEGVSSPPIAPRQADDPFRPHADDDLLRGRNARPPSPLAKDLLMPVVPATGLLIIQPTANPQPSLGPRTRVRPMSTEGSTAAAPEPLFTNLSYYLLSPTTTLSINGNTLIGNDVGFPWPVASSSADLPEPRDGVEQKTLRFIFERSKLPDGTEVHKGSGSFVVYVRQGNVVGMKAGSVTVAAGASLVQRVKDVPIALVGHRGTPGELRFGGAIVQDGALLGLMPASKATVDGLELRTFEREASYKLTPPDSYDLGAGMTVAQVPMDRTLTITGKDITLLVGGERIRLLEGTVRVANGVVTALDDATKLERKRDVIDPSLRASHAVGLMSGAVGKWPARPDAQLFVNGVSPHDVDQGLLGDCFVLGSVMAVARVRPDLIESMIRDNGDGTYAVRFYEADGREITKTVDTDTYFSQKNTPYRLYARTKDERELWPLLVEKAYAAMQPQGYETLDAGGYSSDVLAAITGKRVQTRLVNPALADTNFASVKTALAERRAVVAITQSPDGQAGTYEDGGLLMNHAYAVLGVEEQGGEKYIVLRNPWGNLEFARGTYGNDIDVTGDGVVDGDDGNFRMRLDDFAARFSLMSIVQA